MRLFVSTSCVEGVWSLSAKLNAFREVGLRDVELSQFVTVPSDPATWLSEVREATSSVLLHNYFPPPSASFVLNLASPDESIRHRSMALVRHAIDLSAALRAPFYSVHAGFVTDAYAFAETHFLLRAASEPQAVDRALERFVVAVRELDEHARRAGVRLLLENNNCPSELRDLVLFRTAEDVLQLLKRVASDNVGVLLDTGHLRVAATSLGFDYEEAARRLMPHVGALHLHDNDGQADYHRAVGTGSWALEVARDALAKDVPIIVEAHFPAPADLAAHVVWLDRQLG